MSHILLSAADLKARGITIGRVQLWRLEKSGQFPRRVQVSPGRVAWVEKEIEEYIARKISKRDAK